MATTQDYINQLKTDKQNLVSMLNTMGVEANNNETFTALTPKVGKIVTEPILQDKTIEITENGTINIAADEGYNGLNNVDVTVNVKSSGEEEETLGITFSDYDNAGYPLTATFKKYIQIPLDCFRFDTTSRKYIYSKIKKIILNEGVTNINNYCFFQLTTLEDINFPSTLTTIGTNVFQSCKLTSVSLGNNIYNIGSQSFRACSNLKAVWIGSGVNRYSIYDAFSGCSNLAKIFINLPRATVEKFQYYSSAFSNGTLTTDVIICNDDEGFITKEEFDAIDWATYTG